MFPKSWLVRFPKGNLADFESEAKETGLVWNALDENHIVISGCTKLDKFEQWKQGVIANGSKAVVELACENNNPPKNYAVASGDELLHLYRIAYDLCLYVFRTTSKVSKNFKFGLTDKIREETLAFMEHLHMVAGGVSNFEKNMVKVFVSKARIKFRLLCDLQQISTKQWLFINKQLEDLLKFSGQSPAIQGLQERANLVQ